MSPWEGLDSSIRGTCVEHCPLPIILSQSEAYLPSQIMANVLSQSTLAKSEHQKDMVMGTQFK